MEAITRPKSLWGGEIGLIGVLAILALACLLIAAKTIEPAYALSYVARRHLRRARHFRDRQALQRACGRTLRRWRSTARPTTISGRQVRVDLAACSGASPGFTVGLCIAFELAFPALNFDLPWINFGRLRPLHTSAVIFAFGGNVLLGTSFYVVQRTCRARLAGDLAPWFVVLGLPVLHRDRRHRLSARHHPGQGIRRAGMVCRPVADDRLGRLSAGVPRHALEAQGAAHLRRELVLSRLHRHHRGAASRQQSRRCRCRCSAPKSYIVWSRRAGRA